MALLAWEPGPAKRSSLVGLDIDALNRPSSRRMVSGSRDPSVHALSTACDQDRGTLLTRIDAGHRGATRWGHSPRRRIQWAALIRLLISDQLYLCICVRHVYHRAQPVIL